MSSEDRRTPDTTRIPFEGLVEVGGASGPTFEAQAVNVSEDGLQVRSAYLPEPGQPLTCRFDVGAGHSVIAAGEVVWAHGNDKGGELGIRFTEMDSESVDALKRTCADSTSVAPAAPPGSKVRLHIDGLASPMRAKIRDSRTDEITVGSELGFLQVGKQLELEDPKSGSKRPASIDSVEVMVDPSSQVPQLVVTLRYADVPPSAERLAQVAVSSEASPAAVVAKIPDDTVASEAAARQLKGTIAHNVSQIAPAFERLAAQAKTTVALLAKRHRDRMSAEDPAAPRRTTAPPPGGGLHANGRRVVRGETAETSSEAGAKREVGRMSRRKVALGCAVMIAAVLGAIAIKKSHREVSAESAPASSSTSVGAPPAVSVAAAPASSVGVAAPVSSAATDTNTAAGASSPVAASPTYEDSDTTSSGAHKKHLRVAPFGNGSVHHGNIMRLKMDGAIESIEGAQQPTGFVVKLPGRRSLEAAGPLAARDARIAVIKVANEPAGAELTVAFRDGVPNYRVSAKGDTLIISLAQMGMLEETVAKKDQGGGKATKHVKHDTTHEK